MGHVFISYSKKDRNLIQRLQDCWLALGLKEKTGLDIWYDKHLLPGRDYARLIEEKILTADAVITLFTKNSVRSKWVYFETELASQLHKLVPLRLDKCELPDGLERLQYYDIDLNNSADRRWEGIIEQIDIAIREGRDHVGEINSLADVTWAKTAISHSPNDFKDFIYSFPNDLRRAEAEALYKKYVRIDSRSKLWWLCVGTLLYTALLLPNITLFKDYNIHIAFTWITIYFHYFGFFVIFGTMMVPIYCFSLAKAIRFGYSGAYFRLPAFARRLVTILILIVAPAVLCVCVTAIEVDGGFAPWQFTPKVLSQPLKDYTDVKTDRSLQTLFLDISTTNFKSAWDSRNDTDTSVVTCLVTGTNIPAKDCNVAMQTLKHSLEFKLKTDPTAHSLTDKAYVYSFFFFAVTFLGTYFNLFFLCLRPEKARTWMARLAPWSGQRYGQLLSLLAIQLLFISVWFVARLMFQLETNTIVAQSSGTNFDDSIRTSYLLYLVVYFVAVGFVVAAAFRLRGSLVRLGIVFAAFLTTTFLGLAFSVTAFFHTLQFIIGSRAGMASLLILAIVLAVTVFIPIILPNLLERQEEQISPSLSDDDFAPGT